MASGKGITLHPALEGMLRQHLNDSTALIGGLTYIVRQQMRNECGHDSLPLGPTGSSFE